MSTRVLFAMLVAGAAISLAPPLWAQAEDYDRDGVPDVDDDCPTDPGTAANRGCREAPKPPPKMSKARVEETAEVRGDQIELPRPLEFETGSSRMTADSAPLVEALAKAARQIPNEKLLLIRGHTDNRGARAANVLLSRRRAEAVMKALVAAGVPPARLSSEGLGPDEPIADNASEAGRGKNRRVEFKIVDAAAGRGKKG